MFEVEVLTANNNSSLLIKQAKKFKPNVVVIANKQKYDAVNDALSIMGIKVFCGEESLEEVVEIENIDLVVTALVGYSGLKPTIRAIKSGTNIALANKETLVVAGGLITQLCSDYNVQIYPVDSEHSAIFQCLVGEDFKSVDRLILTASGGPFLNRPKKQFNNISISDALKHPNWKMGNKITIDSATLMNKGFELIEAYWLFGLSEKCIDIIIHPESIIHSLVEFVDGSTKAQLGVPDMTTPILYALGFPKRIKYPFKSLNLIDYSKLTFFQPDKLRFPHLQLAYDCLKRGGSSTCSLNAANEIAVNAFLNKKISFVNMFKLVEKSLEKSIFVNNPQLDDYLHIDVETRKITSELIHKI